MKTQNNLLSLLAAPIVLLTGPTTSIFFPSTAFGNPVCQEQVQTFRPQLADCSVCHGNDSASNGRKWLSGDEMFVVSEVESLLQDDSVRFIGPQENYIAAKITGKYGLGHAGGTQFSAETQQSVFGLIAGLVDNECVATSSATPTGQAQKMEMVTFERVEVLVMTLTNNSQKMRETLEKAALDLGYPDYRLVTNSKIPISPVSSQILQRVLRTACAEVIFGGKATELSDVDFPQWIKNLWMRLFGFSPNAADQAFSVLDEFIKNDSEFQAKGASKDLYRFEMCHIPLRSELLWIN